MCVCLYVCLVVNLFVCLRVYACVGQVRLFGCLAGWLVACVWLRVCFFAWLFVCAVACVLACLIECVCACMFV